MTLSLCTDPARPPSPQPSPPEYRGRGGQKRDICQIKTALAIALIAFGLLCCPNANFAQPPARDELLALVPSDAGFCLIVQNLRGQAERWNKSVWIKAVRAAPLGQVMAASPEIQKLTKVREDLAKLFQVEWASLRDDILGDAFVLAYWPPPPGQTEQEQGLLLVRPRNPELLSQLIKRLNEEQTKNGELKDLKYLEYKGVKYQRRVDARSTHYVLLADNVFVFTRKEQLLRGVIDSRQADRNATKNVIAQQVARAGVERALAILWVNPRAFEPELERKAQKSTPEAVLLRSFLAYWRPLEAIVLSLGQADDVEVRLAMQARTKEMPASIRKAFDEPPQATNLWARFPAGAVLSMAGRLEPGELAESIGEFLTPENRKEIVTVLQKTAGAAIGLNLAKDVLPNIGPDWGVCIAAAPDKQFPHMFAVLSVKPGSSRAPVDRALVNGVRGLATLAMIGHNSSFPDRPVHLKTAIQDGVEVCYLTGEQVFPAGMQPAWAVKDGFLIVASSPEALARFHAADSTTPTTSVEAPILKVSTTELAKILRERRQSVVDHLAEKNQIPKLVANQMLETALGVMDLLDSVTLAHGSGNGQMIWTLRLKPRAGQPHG